MRGFEFRETMAGSYHLADKPMEERPMSFTIRASTPNLFRFLKKPEVRIEGEVDADGFADHRRLEGTLGMDLLRTGTLPYRFRFQANDGKDYVFEGTKTVSVAELVETMTVLPGVLLDGEGKEVGRALLRFDLRSDLVKFLRSFRLGH